MMDSKFEDLKQLFVQTRQKRPAEEDSMQD